MQAAGKSGRPARSHKGDWQTIGKRMLKDIKPTTHPVLIHDIPDTVSIQDLIKHFATFGPLIDMRYGYTDRTQGIAIGLFRKHVGVDRLLQTRKRFRHQNASRGGGVAAAARPEPGAAGAAQTPNAGRTALPHGGRPAAQAPASGASRRGKRSQAAKPSPSSGHGAAEHAPTGGRPSQLAPHPAGVDDLREPPPAAARRQPPARQAPQPAATWSNPSAQGNLEPSPSAAVRHFSLVSPVCVFVAFS
jgi:hypothetical protein